MTESAQDQDGFTLVELLVVIVVLGVLAAIVIFAIGSTREQAVEATCATRVRAITESAEAVHVKTDVYPVGTIDDGTAANPLVAPQAGALLTAWPTSSNFVLRYVGTGGTSYTINVYEGDGTTSVAGCSAL